MDPSQHADRSGYLEVIDPDEVDELPVASPPRPVEPAARNLPEVRVAGAAAAGGLVAGAVAVAAVKLVRQRSRKKPARSKRRRRGKRELQSEPLLSRSFLVDVHLLK